MPASFARFAAKPTTCPVSIWKTTPCPSNALPLGSRATLPSEEPAARPALASTRAPESMLGEFASARSVLAEEEIRQRQSSAHPFDPIPETDLRSAYLFVGTNA